MVRWEQALQKALLLPSEKRAYFVKFNVDGLLRGDYASRMNGYAVGIKTAKTAVFGTFNMLGLAKRNKAKILQASTSEVYGDPLSHPQREGDWGNVNPIGYRSCYDEGKRCAETLCMDYYRQHGVLVKIIRIFNTYGPNMLTDDGRVISNFVVQALLDKDITIYGDGKQTRSFQYIDDLVEGMTRKLREPSLFPGTADSGGGL